MGQYFAAANLDKQEFICPWCLRGGAKLWEWAANPQGSIFTLLLRKSTQSGGGDYGTKPTTVAVDGDDPTSIATEVAKALAAEGQPFAAGDDIVGRWAGDRVVLVGDYDASNLWQKLYREQSYHNISEPLVDTWNSFIELPDLQLRYEPCSSCTGS